MHKPTGRTPLLLAVLSVIALLAAQAAWGANTFSAFRVNENVAHFNMYDSSFLAEDKVHISADYKYDGSEGYPVWVGMEARLNGNRNTHFGYVPQKIASGTKGRATVRMGPTATSMPRVTSPIVTDQIVFTMYKGGRVPFYTKAFDVKIIWPKRYADITRADIAAVDTVTKASTTRATPTKATRTLAAPTRRFAKPVGRTLSTKTIKATKTPLSVREIMRINPALLLYGRLSTSSIKIGMTTQFALIVGKTNKGRYFKALCEHRPNSDLRLKKWHVFAANGSMHRSGANTRIQRTYTIDLDSGSTTGSAKDLQWEFATETDRGITPLNGAKIAKVYFRYANYELNHVPVKKIYLELDKIAGSDWTPYVVERGGGKHSMESIYASVNIELKVVHDDGYITDLKNGAAYSRADMDSFFAAQYNTSGPAGYWHMHGAMLTRDTSGNLGVMYRTSDRKGFALFATEFGFAGADKDDFMLRTSAHELGHALNLFHSDGDANVGGAPVAGRGTTVMNQTWTRAPNWGYDWHTPSRNHLNNHPINRIQPGTGHGFGDTVTGAPWYHVGLF